MTGQHGNEPPATTVPTGISSLEVSGRVRRREQPELLVITGMSGAGRTKAAAVLEDLDWYVVDNLPAQLLTQLAGMLSTGPGGVHRLAAVVDVRGREFFADLVNVIDSLQEAGIAHRILFLEASDAVLVQRFEAVRRPHPLQGDGRILDGIAEERALLAEVKSRADVVLDTSDLTVHDLAREVRAAVSGDEDGLRVHVVSFGFKYGLPLDADHVVDVRFLANPYWISELRHLTGRDEPVRDYVLGLPRATEFVARYADALDPVLDGYLQEDKRYVTIAIGCTGGKHRSVALAEALAGELRGRGHRVAVTHRDLGRE
ncbi:RNase adapter RapZ [Actinotalea fermentans]|uniref:Nucleotide-binding protein n=1 Tax=Actinotalea fermentans TaxID=43671 RepID=A0A511YV08_9CELL|nr:RNase adapter RapZ [Actinotalea fermentans]KGM17872.1 glmZ(sRNA)-inactivating NTPase [Actinotalea fermentans ATCC 43279 = JCM 9966 = DSM 3133]GEN79032.1 nucleotide-binding protein [Actinotalea fermentans]